MDVLDEVVYSSLTGAHAHLARGGGRAVAFPAEMSPVAGLAPDPVDEDWRALAAAVEPGESLLMATAETPRLPEGWQLTADLRGLQMVATESVAGAADPEAVPLGYDDLPEVLDLIARTEPGPFHARTLDFGGYLGIRREGRLVAMAGQRLRPAGYAEVSAVCTDEAYRGRGFAARLTLAVAHAMRARGETPILHLFASNTPALRLYTALGFETRCELAFTAVLAPDR